MTALCIAHVKTTPESIEFLRATLRSGDLYMAETANGSALVLTLPDDGLTPTDAWNEAQLVVQHVMALLHVYANMADPIEIVAPVSAHDETGAGQAILAMINGSLRVTSKEGRKRLLEMTTNSSDTIASKINKSRTSIPRGIESFNTPSRS